MLLRWCLSFNHVQLCSVPLNGNTDRVQPCCGTVWPPGWGRLQNEWDGLKRHRHHSLSQAVGMWWNCTVIIAFEHTTAYIHLGTLLAIHSHGDTHLEDHFEIKVLTWTYFWAYVLHNWWRGAFGVTPVSQIQKAGLYSLTADPDTWSCMYRSDTDRWLETYDITCTGSRHLCYTDKLHRTHGSSLYGDSNMCRRNFLTHRSKCS